MRRMTQYLRPGANVIGIPFAGSAPIGTSNLKVSGWTQDNNFSALSGSSTADLLPLVTGVSFGTPVFTITGRSPRRDGIKAAS